MKGTLLAPRRVRVFWDDRVVLLVGVAPILADSGTLREFSKQAEPALLVSFDPSNRRLHTSPMLPSGNVSLASVQHG